MGSVQQKSFNQIEQCLATLPVLVPPTLGRLGPLKLYISAAEDSVGSLLA